MIYKQIKPAEKLDAIVKCYWTLESETEEKPEKQTIVPDGCIEMVFHYGDLYRQYVNNCKSIKQPRCFVFGQLTQPLQIEPTGRTGIFSVRFYPGGFLPFTTIPIKEMENKAISLKKIFDKTDLIIEQNILNASSITERIQIIEAFLLDKLSKKEAIDRVVTSTVDLILKNNGQHSIDKLSKQNNVNHRQLERKFSKAIGLSPKRLSKTIRLQATLNMLINKRFTTLTALAYENEYYDQAHFIKDFKDLTGVTPSEFYGGNLAMSRLFYGTD